MSGSQDAAVVHDGVYLRSSLPFVLRTFDLSPAECAEFASAFSDVIEEADFDFDNFERLDEVRVLVAATSSAEHSAFDISATHLATGPRFTRSFSRARSLRNLIFGLGQ